MRHGSLFSGIGGFDLAAEWAGWENVFHCEINPFGQKVLKHYWPNAISFDDVTNLTIDNYGNLIYIDENGDVIMGREKDMKYDNAVNLYEMGMSIEDCALFYEISRQAMYKILERRKCSFREQHKIGSDNHFYRGIYPDHSKQKKAQHLIEKALNNGAITKPDSCSKCGVNYTFTDGRSAIQAHHYDYDKPLDVIWLCQKCHHEWHKNNTPINYEEEGKKGNPSGGIDVLTGGFP